jgi:hypothetical protein
VKRMDNRAQVREFLASRRGRITPEQAGLPVYGGHRRVSGHPTADSLNLLASWAATADQTLGR